MDIIHGNLVSGKASKVAKEKINQVSVPVSEGEYLDKLDEFAIKVNKCNFAVIDTGVDIKIVRARMLKLRNTFDYLCGSDQSKAKKITPVKPESKQDEFEPLPDNFIRDKDGWGLCPICRRKSIRLTHTTKLQDFPMYCKSCRAEYIVSWWNVENKQIDYTRYVNHQHYTKNCDIYNSALKGNGVKKFMNSRTSSTESVAMSL